MITLSLEVIETFLWMPTPEMGSAALFMWEEVRTVKLIISGGIRQTATCENLPLIDVRLTLM
jgi:hypothetical protein